MLRFAHLALVAVMTLVFGMAGMATNSNAAVSFDNGATAMTVVSTGTTAATVTGTIAKGTGSNRVLLVVLTVGNSAAVTANLSTTTVTYGGQSLTPIGWTSTQRSAIWAGYLKEAGVVAATNTTISATISSASIAGSKIVAAVFKDALSGPADNPIQSYATGLKDAFDAAAVTILTPANTVTVPANGYGIVAVAGNGTTATAYTWSPAAYEGTSQEWVNTTTVTASGSSHAGGASDVAETNISATPNGNSRLSLVAVTLKPAILDATAPTVGTVTITSPAANNGTYVPANVTFTAAITEPDSTPTCQYTTNGSTWVAGVISGASSPYTCTATVTGLTGAVTLNIRASSAGGGPTTGTALSRTVDTTAPATTAAPAAGTYGSDQSVTLTPVDAGVGVASTTYCVDTTNVCVPGTNYTGAVAVTGTPGLSVTKYLRYRATDLFGAVETTKSSQYIIDQSCVESGTVTLNAVPNPITGPVAVTATVGGGASAAQVSFDGGSTWFPSGTTFTPNPQANYTVQFAAKATGNCGGEIFAAGNPTTVNIDSRTNGLEAEGASAVQAGLTSILVTMSYCGDRDGDATYKVDYKLTSSGTWTNGTAVVDATNDGTYTITLNGLTSGLSYDVRMTYADPDGILAGTAVQTAMVTLTAWTDNAMLHNANRFACNIAGYSTQATCEGASGIWDINAKHVGGWGIPGQQYGAFLCSTCHVKGSSNIKRVVQTVTATSGSFPGSSVTFTSAVDGSSNFGNDAGGHATSTNICESCHSLTDVHRYNTTGQPGGISHYNQANCVKCHEHKAGFRASCTACHGNPPLAAGELTGPLPGDDTGSASWGAHNTHAETLGFVCNTCHTGWETTGEMPKVGNINVGFVTPGADGGTYDGRSSGGGYTAGPSTTVLTTKASNTTTCAVYCHGYDLPQWTTTTGTVACGACHGQPGSYGDDRAGAPTGVATSRDLSGALTGFRVGKHANHLDDSIAKTGDPCALCHSGFAYADATHINGTVNVQLLATAGGAGVGATFTAGAPGTCSTLTCHGDAQWNSAAVGGCDFCHGYPPSSTNNKHASGVQAVNHNSLNITPNHDECTYCHGYKDNGTGGLLLLTPAQITAMKGTWTPTSTAHQDGSITMNGGPTAADAGYNVTNGGCDTAACHVNDATHRVGTGNTTSTKSLIAIGPGSCGACHDGGIGGAPVVSSTSSHVKVLKTGVFGDCTDCHAGHTTATGGVDIPNNATVGINYSTTGHTGIQLGGTGTNALISALTTEAQICWACHDSATNAISEWGVNNKANTGSSPYNYGTVTASNWTTATWSSSRTQFAYKTGAIQSTHTANPLVTDAALGGAAYSRTETKNAVAEIRCSNCHDVHDLNRASGDTVTGTPYLRGSWRGNPYEEDGAPRSVYANTTYFTNFVYNTTDVSGAAVTRTYGWGAVPRGSKNQAKIGGYWIDQNNVVPMTATTTGVGTAAKNPTAAWTVDQFAGLCALCHGGGNASWTLTEVDNIDQVPAEAIWMGTNGHANSVKGGTGSASANDFNVYNARTGVTTYGQVPRQHYAGMTEPGDNGSYGFRATEGFGYQPTLSSARGYGYIHDDWVVDDTGATLENQYHKFSCSKCHNPHASRLPKLMITNCLDTVHNTWDNQFQLNPQTGNNLNKELAQWTSAQNCHRYSESNNTTTTSPEYRASRTAGAAGTGAGWNKVTPWKQTTTTP